MFADETETGVLEITSIGENSGWSLALGEWRKEDCGVELESSEVSIVKDCGCN